MVIWVSSNHSPTSVTYSAAGAAAQMTATGPPGERYSFLLDPSAYYPVNSTCQGSHNYTNPECFCEDLDTVAASEFIRAATRIASSLLVAPWHCVLAIRKRAAVLHRPPPRVGPKSTPFG